MGKLFERALRGDALAQSEIHRIVRRIARVACLPGGPGGVDVDWEDVAQEAARRFFSVGIRQYRGDGSEESYLFGIVRATVLQSVRSATRRRQREQAPVSPEQAASRPQDQCLDVRKILDRLSPECARLLEQAFLQDVPYPDLAAEMGILEASVRVKVSRCLRKAMEIAGEETR